MYYCPWYYILLKQATSPFSRFPCLWAPPVWYLEKCAVRPRHGLEGSKYTWATITRGNLRNVFQDPLYRWSASSAMWKVMRCPPLHYQNWIFPSATKKTSQSIESLLSSTKLSIITFSTWSLIFCPPVFHRTRCPSCPLAAIAHAQYLPTPPRIGPNKET